MNPAKDGIFITTGVMTQLALQSCEILKEEGLVCGVLHIHTVKPLDHVSLVKYLPEVRGVVTVEEHTKIGGLGSALLEFCSDNMPEQASKIKRIGLEDCFADQYGNQNSLLCHMGISVENIVNVMRNLLMK